MPFSLRPIKKKARFCYKPRFSLLPAFLPLLLTAPLTSLHAACPTGTTFQTDNQVSRNIRVRGNLRDQALPEGDFSITTPFNLAQGTLSLSLNAADNISTLFNYTNISQRLWQLRVPRSATEPDLIISDLIIEYRIEDDNGNAGFLSSVSNASSKVRITVSQRNLTRQVNNNFITFRGYINLSGNYEDATISGDYSGKIISTVDCL